MKNKFLFLGIFLFVFFIGLVSAEGCCVNPEKGLNLDVVSEDVCLENNKGSYGVEFYDNILCEDLSESQKESSSQGCCIDRENGICTDYQIQDRCEEAGLVWEDSTTGKCEDISASPNYCSVGCCIVNGKGYYETSMSCDKRTNFDEEKTFDTGISEKECGAISRSGEFGACIFSPQSCTYEKQENCPERNQFEPGKYCSEVSNCISGQERNLKTCVEGEADVYFIDSCGNEEGVAEDCTEGQETCALAGGSYTCKDLTVNSVTGETLEDGESVCIYEGSPGNGTSFVGGTHWKQYNYGGELRNESCGDGRSGVCQQITNNRGYSRAVCVPNLVEECFAINTNYFEQINSGELDYEEGINNLRNDCEKSQYCIMKTSESISIDGSNYNNLEPNSFEDKIGDYFGYELCVPKDPKVEIADTEESACSLASNSCSVYFKKNLVGRYECVENCDCLKEESFVKMNDLCTSFGDCGLNVNIIGEKGSGEISYSPTDTKRFGNAYTEDTIEDFRAILGEDGDCGRECGINNENCHENFCNSNRAGIKRWEFYVDLGRIVVPNSEILITDFIKSKFSDSSNEKRDKIELNFPSELQRQVLGEEYDSLSEDQRYQRMIEYIELNDESVEDFVLFNSREFENNRWQKLFFDENLLDYRRFLFGGFVSHEAPLFWPAYLFVGTGKVDTLDVEYQCLDWQAPTGGENCDLCNEGELPCTEYKCESLGQACYFLDDSSTPECVSSDDNNLAPEIEEIRELNNEISVSGRGDNWDLTSSENSGCFLENERIEFGARISELAQCKYSYRSYSTYRGMPGNFPSGNTDYEKEHIFNLNSGSIFEFLTGQQADDYYGCLGDSNKTETECALEAGIDEVDLSFKIRCEDAFGSFSDEVSVNYCLEWAPDENPPRVLGFDPLRDKEWEYNPEEINLLVYLDEQAECKYDYNNVLGYDNLGYNMTLLGKTGSRWIQNATLVNSHIGINSIYIKCKDLSENQNLNNNIIYQYKIKRDITKEEYERDFGLLIDSIFIRDNSDNELYDMGANITTGKNPSLKLEVKTSRGTNNGIAKCYLDENKRIEMKETDSTVHSQIYDGYKESGTYTLNVFCEDDLTEVSNSITFSLIVDVDSPSIVNHTAEGDYLTIFTDEEAKCSYENDDADFNIEEGNNFYESSYSTEHTTAWNPAENYYVRCIDRYDNRGFSGEINAEGELKGPIITRIESVGDSLEILTDRDSMCYYSTKQCDFDISGAQSNSMSGSFGRDHGFDLSSGTKYYIKCEDKFETVNPDCTPVEVYF